MSSDQITRTETLSKLEDNYDKLLAKNIKLRRGGRILIGMHLLQIKAIEKKIEQARYEIYNHLFDNCGCDSIIKFTNYYGHFFNVFKSLGWPRYIKVSKKKVYKIFNQLKLYNSSFKYFIDQYGNIKKSQDQ